MRSPTVIHIVEQRRGDDWLIGYDSHLFNQLLDQRRNQLSTWETPPTILLAERHPIQFLAGFIAACTAGCPVFLANPDWGTTEWQHVFSLVHPTLIWGDAPVPAAHCPTPDIRHPTPPILIPTGGSSGTIRFAIHTWDTLMASVQGFQDYFAIASVNSCCVLPLYHVSGLMQFLRSFTTGGKLAILPFKSLESDGIKDINPSEFFLSLVPTQLQRLLPPAAPTAVPVLATFPTILLGGSPAWSELLETARHYGIRLAPTYGMTETASQIATLKPEDFLQGKQGCGRILPHARVTIRSASGACLPVGEVGAIAIQAASLALGYYPDYADQRELQPDDLGFLDGEGYLHIVGRATDKIITGGENVFPAEVEAVIRGTGLVTDVCVIGVGDRHWGQVVSAVYVPTSAAVSPETLATALLGKLSKFKHPKHWIAVDQLPRNAQGKINRKVVENLVRMREPHRSATRL